MLIYICQFIFGAIMGSAANALIDRLPKNQSWISGRSKCDKCKHELSQLDLIPLLSYVFLKGRCRYCKKKISSRNFWLELGMAVGFVVIGILAGNYSGTNPYQWLVQSIILQLVFWVSVLIGVMDWETRLVSEAMVLLWGVLVGVYLLVNGGLSSLGSVSLLWGVLVGVGVIGGIWAVSRGRAMGFGDVEIAAVMGLWLGWPKITVALWMAFVIGSIVGVGKVVVKKGKLKDQIAFGPFLIVGTWIAYFWSEKIFSLIGLR